MQGLPPEVAHALALRALPLYSQLYSPPPEEDVLRTTVWERSFSSPLGLAAGFDKNAEVVDPCLKLGFGFVEVGAVTPRPQPGNPKPRLFRLPEHGALINRLGFNNKGHAYVARRLRRRRGKGVVGVNLGRHKEGGLEEYVEGVRLFSPLADFLVINVSSPNTPGLRLEQSQQKLEALLDGVRASCASRAVPLLVKIAPDISEDEQRGLVELADKVDGFVISNTTLTRPPSMAHALHGSEQGGLSGKPLAPLAVKLLRRLYKDLKGQTPLIGVGGIMSGAEAYARIRAGASLLQIYTAFVYGGVEAVETMKRDLARYLIQDGFSSVQEAVGADHG